MIVYCDMAVTIERSAFAAQSVAFISDSPHARLKSNKQQACSTTHMCEPLSSHECPFGHQCHLLMASKIPRKLMDH